MIAEWQTHFNRRFSRGILQRVLWPEHRADSSGIERLGAPDRFTIYQQRCCVVYYSLVALASR